MRRAALVLAALAVLGSAACSHDSRPATWEPGAAGSPAPTVVTPQAEGGTGPRPAFTENPDGTLNRSGGPPPSTSDAKLSAGGLGPYKIGASVESLQTAKLITGAKPAAGCANYTTAKGTSKYHSPQLIFFKGRLLYLTIGSDAVQTDKGIAIGSPLAKVKGSYPNGKVLNGADNQGAEEDSQLPLSGRTLALAACRP